MYKSTYLLKHELLWRPERLGRR